MWTNDIILFHADSLIMLACTCTVALINNNLEGKIPRNLAFLKKLEILRLEVSARRAIERG